MVSSSFRRGHFVRLWLGFVCLLGIPALAQNPASYEGIKKDDFMRRWLVLEPIPITAESSSKPDEEAQKKAFEKDWLGPYGGETRIAPSLNRELAISGKSYR